jgi:hypothetical protein
MKTFLTGVTIVAVCGLTFSNGNAAERSSQLPTATEVFQLRSLCVKLGEQLDDEMLVGSALTKDHVSRYDPRSNRCYVELMVHKISPKNEIDDYVNRTIYDAQTKELLAFAKIEKGKRVGMIFDPQHGVADVSKNLGWDDANAYIDEMMLDDRK